MRPRLCLLALLFGLAPVASRAADDYKPGPDSLPQAGVPKGELIKGQHVAKEGSVFPGTEREYTIYLPPGLDKSKPSPFMVFQDGVIYQAPVVFDNLIAKKEIPPLIGIFIKPGIVPAASANALPRFNRSYEYDSVTDTYARFLIDELLPAIAKQHSLNLSERPDDAAIAGNSSGGICAFMVAWHRPDRFRRVFTGVGTYVGIHGADQLPVLVRKMEPKPLRVYLQSGINDNNLYCGDWWMANQTMERSLTWAGYDVNHTWGEGGHNAKHATAIFPDVLRWLWRGWPEEGLRANPGNTSKWLGYEVLGSGGWEVIKDLTGAPEALGGQSFNAIAFDTKGNLYTTYFDGVLTRIGPDGKEQKLATDLKSVHQIGVDGLGQVHLSASAFEGGSFVACVGANGAVLSKQAKPAVGMAVSKNGNLYASWDYKIFLSRSGNHFEETVNGLQLGFVPGSLAFSPDQTLLYASDQFSYCVWSFQVRPDGSLCDGQRFYELQLPDQVLSSSTTSDANGMCVDVDGRLYVPTRLGIQVCDQAGRVNFIIPTPQQPYDVCFGGKDLGELFIACGDKIYKRPMKVHGIVSGQMVPIKPKAPHL